MWYETDSLDSPLVIIEGPSDPITGPASPVVLEAIARYQRLLAERESDSALKHVRPDESVPNDPATSTPS
jgi:hypothetical protein